MTRPEDKGTGPALLIFTIFLICLNIYFLTESIGDWNYNKRCDKILTETCIVNSCEQVAQECYEPCSPQPCTQKVINCSTYDLFFTLSYNGINYTRKERSDHGCPINVACRFYPCNVQETLTLGYPYIFFDWAWPKIGFVVEGLIFIAVIVMFLISYAMISETCSKSSPNAPVQLQETA